MRAEYLLEPTGNFTTEDFNKVCRRLFSKYTVEKLQRKIDVSNQTAIKLIRGWYYGAPKIGTVRKVLSGMMHWNIQEDIYDFIEAAGYTNVLSTKEEASLADKLAIDKAEIVSEEMPNKAILNVVTKVLLEKGYCIRKLEDKMFYLNRGPYETREAIVLCGAIETDAFGKAIPWYFVYCTSAAEASFVLNEWIILGKFENCTTTGSKYKVSIVMDQTSEYEKLLAKYAEFTFETKKIVSVILFANSEEDYEPSENTYTGCCSFFKIEEEFTFGTKIIENRMIINKSFLCEESNYYPPTKVSVLTGAMA